MTRQPEYDAELDFLRERENALRDDLRRSLQAYLAIAGVDTESNGIESLTPDVLAQAQADVMAGLTQLGRQDLFGAWTAARTRCGEADQRLREAIEREADDETLRGMREVVDTALEQFERVAAKVQAVFGENGGDQ